MTLLARFSIFLLLLSFLQPWRLTASTPGAEDVLKYVTEEESHLFDEITGEESSINHLPPPNAVQTAPHVIEERLFIIQE